MAAHRRTYNEPEVPRDLRAAERAVLERLLTRDFDGSDDLKAQTASVQVVGHCGCGCPTIDLAPSSEAQAASALAELRLAPVEGRTTVADGLPGEILLFLENGRLSSLEYVYYGEVPSSWPDPAGIDLVV